MPTITGITARKGNKKRADVFVDGAYFGTLELLTIAENRLKADTEIEESALAGIIAEDNRNGALNTAAALLGRSVKSEREVRKYLFERGYGKDAAEFAVEKLKGFGYIDDRAFALAYLAQNSAKYGRDKLLYELRSRGVDSETAKNALEDFGANVETDAENCLEVARKYMSGKEKSEKNRERLIRYLAGRGFSGSALYSSVKTVCAESGDDEFED